MGQTTKRQITDNYLKLAFWGENARLYEPVFVFFNGRNLDEAERAYALAQSVFDEHMAAARGGVVASLSLWAHCHHLPESVPVIGETS